MLVPGQNNQSQPSGNAVNYQPPQVPDIEWKDSQFRFDGKWIPNVDPALIGANNYAELTNLRYRDSGLEGVAGYSRVNWVGSVGELDGTAPVAALGNYPYIRNGYQLKTQDTQKTFTLVHSLNAAGGQGRVFVNRTAIGSAGHFDATTNFWKDADNLIGGGANVRYPYFQDKVTGLTGRFSDAPQGNITYTNSQESMIFGGDEQPVAAAFLVDINTTELMPNQVDRDFSGASAWADVDLAGGGGAYDETNDLTLLAGAAGINDYCTLLVASAPTTIGKTYRLYYDLANIVESWTVKDFTGAQTLGTISANGTQAHIDFIATTTGGLRLVAAANNAAGDFDNFSLVELSMINPVDVTDIVNNSLTDADNIATIDRAGQEFMMIFTTRPVQSFKLYIETANKNTEDPSTSEWWYWNGTGWTTYMNTDGTLTSTISMSKTGTVTLTNHTDNLVKLKHFEELYMYGYLVELQDGGTDVATAGITRITADCAFQSIKDVWDGVYRQPIQFQLYDLSETAAYDYTLQVNEPSSISSPVGAEINGMLTSDATPSGDYIYIMFTDQMAAIRCTMLSTLINSNATVSEMDYWDGDSWTTLTLGTHEWIDGTTGFKTSGVISWTPQTDEQPQTLYGSFGYAYRIRATSAAISGAIGTDPPTVVIDLVSGIPAQRTVKPYVFTSEYKSRVMLLNYSAGNESNRVDFSAADAPDVYNGSDSSDYGGWSLRFGGNEPITAAAQLYNRFGSNILTMLLVLKEASVYILIGDTPDDFKQYPVSSSLGCPAPLTLATAEVNLEEEDSNLTRNVAIFLSNAGPLMFDGATLSPIRGIENYFDPTNSEYVEWDNITNARGWIDTTYKEYNMLIPSSSGQVSNNKWFVYDLVRRKWFLKDTGLATVPQAAFQVATEAGERMIYGGIDAGLMIQLENSTTWDTATAITQVVKTGDFFPSKNMWDETTIRKFKLLVHKFEDVGSNNILDIYYYNNTDTLIGTGVSFGTTDFVGVSVTFTDDDVEWDTVPSTRVNVDVGVQSQRLLKINTDHNYTGWAHSFKFSISTTDVTGGFRPVAWGIQYRVEKKDNQATQ